MKIEQLGKYELVAQTEGDRILATALVGNIKDSPLLLLKIGSDFSNGVSLVMSKDEMLTFLSSIRKVIKAL